MDRDFFGGLEAHACPVPVDSEGRAAGRVPRSLRCCCGSGVFRLTGWPRVVTGSGGFFWRSMIRVLREARVATRPDGEPLESPFRFPISALCEACGRESILFDHEAIADRIAPGQRDTPKEAIRCRICGRARFELVAGLVPEPATGLPVGFDLTVRCHACRREARLAWSDGERTAQQRRIDLLYGRR
ncbi:MAG TPA: hypothetical protein ENI85_01840 [Deltaproteobacteria bacterium]|nr:hypothetical protein [Deltaproteobacteria bacterium]